jgi:hypothetical protein
MVSFLQIGALVFFFLAAFGFAGPLKAGELPETMPPYIFLFGCFVLLGLAEIVRRLPAAK